MVVAAADLRAPARADAAIPTVQVVDGFDLNDLLTDAARPTADLITVTVNADGTASFALPRAEVGQGITTSIAMLIAEELDLAARTRSTSRWPTPAPSCCSTSSPAARTRCTRSTPRPRRGGHRQGRSCSRPRRKGSATPAQELKTKHGVITRPDGRATNYGDLTREGRGQAQQARSSRA